MSRGWRDDGHGGSNPACAFGRTFTGAAINWHTSRPSRTNCTCSIGMNSSSLGLFATFLGASPDDAGGAELGWLFASVLQNVGNSLVKGGMNHVAQLTAPAID
jgi:hypothetical protein